MEIDSPTQIRARIHGLKHQPPYIRVRSRVEKFSPTQIRARIHGLGLHNPCIRVKNPCVQLEETAPCPA
jgi:hypothetical protein